MASEPTSRLGARALCLALCWAAGFVVASPAPARAAPAASRPSDDGTAERVARLLRESPGATAESVAAALVGLGPKCVPAIFELLRGAPATAEPAGADSLRISSAQRDGLLLALKRMPEAWRAHCARLAASAELRPARLSAVRVVGEIGASADFPLLFALARTADGSDAAARPAREPESLDDDEAAAFQAAIEKVLARDPRGLFALEGCFLSADVSLQPFVVRAIANQKCTDALELLARLLGTRSELDRLILTQIGKLAGALAPPFDGAALEHVRAFMSVAVPDTLREAALTVGKLEDPEALPLLIALLSHEHRGVRENALWSLKKITGQGFAEDPKSWLPWLEQENRWWQERAPGLFVSLETAERPEALAIVQEIARRRIPRHALAAELARALRHPDAEVRRLTCVALAQFRSRVAVRPLAGCLEDSEEGVRDEALRALRSITGLDLPPVPAAWAGAGV